MNTEQFELCYVFELLLIYLHCFFMLYVAVLDFYGRVQEQ